MDADYGAGAMDIGESTSAAINIPGSGGHARNDDETDYLSTSAPGEGGNRNGRFALCQLLSTIMAPTGCAGDKRSAHHSP